MFNPLNKEEKHSTHWHRHANHTRMPTTTPTSEILRLLHNLVRLGHIEQVDYPTARARVRTGENLTGWLPWVTRRAGEDVDWWAPEVGEQVILFSPGGDPASAVIMGAIYQASHPAPADTHQVHRTRYADGTTVEYDREGSTLTINCVGTVIVNAEGQVNVTAGDKATIDAPAIHHNGGSPVVTTAHICHFTGNPHGDGSSTVTAGK
jgi:phage baseplate assembly protein V